MCVPPGGILDLCRTELESLSSRLSFDSEAGSKTSRIVKQLKWPLKKKETKRHIESIRGYTENIAQSVQADQISITLAMKNAMDSKPKILHQKIDGRLCAVDSSVNYRRAKRKRRPGTALWFIEGECFTQWKSQSPSFCWLYGMVGSRKSVMSSVIVEHISHECSSNNLSLALAYFYFDFTAADKLTPEKVGDLLPILQEIMRTFKETFIVLDALDVCSNIVELLHTVKEILPGTSSQVHLLGTSRDVKGIEEEVDSLPGKVQKVPMDKSQMNDDISTFTQECLLSKSDGILFEMLGNCVDVRSLREALASSPTPLNAVYERILLGTDRKWENHASELLRWLAFSARPLTIAELAGMRIVNVDNYRQLITGRKLFDPREISEICSPFVKIDAAEGPCEVLRLAHLSVKEYMVPDSTASGPVSQYHASGRSTNAEMAGICLAYLFHLVALAEGLLSPDNFSYSNWIRLYDPEYPWREANYYRSKQTIRAPLHYMALTGMADLTDILLAEGVNSDAYRGFYATPLQAAGAMGHLEVTKRLIEQGADVHIDEGGYGNALRLATKGGHAEIVELLLEKGADVNAYGPLLRDAAGKGHADLVKRLLQIGQDPNTHDEIAGTALQLARTFGHSEVVDLLLENGADLSIRGGIYDNPLQAAPIKDAKGGTCGKRTQRRILQEPPSYRRGAGGRPILERRLYGNVPQAASLGGDTPVVKSLISCAVDVNTFGGKYGTALQAAASKAHVEIIQILTDHANSVFRYKRPQFTTIVRLLLEKHADSNSSGGLRGPRSTLELVARRGHIGVVRVML
ncbi:hypothetical protein ACJ73_07539 [Blastomyces percursus]|uniref:Uncharacterized protein n=1 Tax=Blastomyces percursus TaxID=1658174 RepID=A0A1J9QLM9_9EURO|nr:hypothetical protein ACJ73_07539 [Blastomyces percursus]